GKLSGAGLEHLAHEEQIKAGLGRDGASRREHADEKGLVRRLGDVHPGAVLDADEAERLQLPQRFAHGREPYVELARQLADRGKPLTRPELPGPDQLLNPARHLAGHFRLGNRIDHGLSTLPPRRMAPFHAFPILTFTLIIHRNHLPGPEPRGRPGEKESDPLRRRTTEVISLLSLLEVSNC